MFNALISYCALASGGDCSVASARVYLEKALEADSLIGEGKKEVSTDTDVNTGLGNAAFECNCTRCRINHPLTMYTVSCCAIC